MAIQKRVPATIVDNSVLPISPDTSLNARDRLLEVLKQIPRLSQEDVEAMNRLIKEAREASIADELSA
jgi:hypothetical protein